MKPKQNYSYNTAPRKDFCQTAPYAVTPVVNFLKLNSIKTVLEPANGLGFLTKALYSRGISVIESDILDGRDFLTTEKCSYPIVTNPPFSIKLDFLKKAYELNVPFALLLPGETVFLEEAQKLRQEHGAMWIFMDRRIDFYMPGKGFQGGGAQMPTFWWCRWLYDNSEYKSIYHVSINEERTLYKNYIKHIMNRYPNRRNQNPHEIFNFYRKRGWFPWDLGFCNGKTGVESNN